MQMNVLQDICNDMSVKISYEKNLKESLVHLNLIYEPPKQLEDIFSKKKPDKLAVIKNGYIYFENSSTSSKDITFHGLTKRGFRDRLTNSKIELIQHKIEDIDTEIERCSVEISKVKTHLNEKEKKLSELKTARKLLISELKTLKDNLV